MRLEVTEQIAEGCELLAASGIFGDNAEEAALRVLERGLPAALAEAANLNELLLVLRDEPEEPEDGTL